IPLGKADVKRAGKDCTIVAWSKSLHTALEAAKLLAGEGVDVEVVDPRTLRPLDEEAIFASVKKTHRLVIVQEGWPVWGYAAEVAYRAQRPCLDYLDAPIERVTSEDVPMPYARNLELDVLPAAKDVVAAVKRAMYLEE